MYTLRNKLIAAAVVVILAVVGSLMSAHQVSSQGPPGGLAVQIVNPLPVPTTGTSTVSGAVAATQSGSWNVGIKGQPIGVDVNNSPTVTLPTHLGIPAANIVTLTTKLGKTCMPFGSFCQIKPDGTFVTTPFVIPTGQQLVITDVKIFLDGLTPFSQGSVLLNVGSQIVYALAAESDGFGDATAAEHLTSGLVLSVAPTETPFAGVNISGYLVPLS